MRPIMGRVVDPPHDLVPRRLLDQYGGDHDDGDRPRDDFRNDDFSLLAGDDVPRDDQHIVGSVGCRRRESRLEQLELPVHISGDHW